MSKRIPVHYLKIHTGPNRHQRRYAALLEREAQRRRRIEQQREVRRAQRREQRLVTAREIYDRMFEALRG